MKKILTNFLVLLWMLPVFSIAQAEEQWQAGKHYHVLSYPVRTRDASKVEVVELFWYGCPHCYSFNPLVHHWAKNLSDDVDFWLSPATFGKTWELHAQAFYAGEALGVQEKMHQPLFDAIARDHKPLSSQSALAKFFAGYGVDEDAFNKAFTSFSVKAKLGQANSRARGYRATGVPALVVNGKYRIDASSAGGHENMLKVADFLIEQERSTIKGSAQ